mgnify:FL=1
MNVAFWIIKKKHINALILACKKEDQQAQMELYQRYSQNLYYSAYRIEKNADDALDAVQEGFITAFQKLDQYQGGGSFEGWLHKIVIRKSIKYYQNNKHFVNDDFLENRTELSENHELTEEHAPRLEKGQLENVLQKLSERYQIILKLYYLEGYDHQGISEIMNWSYANCRTTLSRAREQLKKQLL